MPTITNQVSETMLEQLTSRLGNTEGLGLEVSNIADMFIKVNEAYKCNQSVDRPKPSFYQCLVEAYILYSTTMTQRYTLS